MEFCIQLSAYYPDVSYSVYRIYYDMLVQALLADTLSYNSVSIVKHHLINCFMMPAPLQLAVQIASLTDRLKILTSIVVLPIHCMPKYAGEVVLADIFTEGRIFRGVVRGTFGYETKRLGVPLEET